MRFLHNSIVLFFLTASLTGAESAHAQSTLNPRWDTEEKLGSPLFAMKAFRRFSEAEDSVRLDVAVEIPHDMLQFVRESGGFIARAEVSLSVFNNAGAQLTRRNQRVEKAVRLYDQTNLPNEYLTSTTTMLLPPGGYSLKAVFTDMESHRRETKTLAVQLDPTSSAAVELSDLMLCRSSEIDRAQRIPVQLLVEGKIPDEKASLYCFFEIHRSNPLHSTRISLQVFNSSSAEVWFDSLSILGGEEIASYFMPVRLEGLTFGEYELILKVHSGTERAERRTQFTLNYHGIPTTIRDLDLAISQLELIATRNEIAELRSAPHFEREKRFIDFWNRIYPPQGNGVNGKMVEYYSRVNYTVQQFGNSRPGWESDRGRIYIIYGQPDEVERHPFEDNTPPYEIWYYHRLNKRFLFRDEFGFGEFRLVTPAW